MYNVIMSLESARFIPYNGRGGDTKRQIAKAINPAAARTAVYRLAIRNASKEDVMLRSLAQCIGRDFREFERYICFAFGTVVVMFFGGVAVPFFWYTGWEPRDIHPFNWTMLVLFVGAMIAWAYHYGACAIVALRFRISFGRYPVHPLHDEREFWQVKEAVVDVIRQKAFGLRDVYRREEEELKKGRRGSELEKLRHAIKTEKRDFYRMVDTATSSRLPNPYYISRNYKEWVGVR